MNEETKRLRKEFIKEVLYHVENELESAMITHEALHNSYHESFAVLKEEVDELWDEIKKKNVNDQNVFHEAIQVAAMAIRMIVDQNIQVGEGNNFKIQRRR